MRIDIRDSGSEEITEIVFGDGGDPWDGYILYLENNWTKIRSMDGEVCIDSKEDALNLIKALQKAIELGNWDD